MKTLRHLFTALLLLCATVASAFHFRKDGIYYNITSSRTVEVTHTVYHNTTGYPLYSGSVVIPSTVTYDGQEYQVTRIGDEAFYRSPSITSITIPESVTSIGENAFYNLTLSSLTIPESITSIEKDAFYFSTIYTVNINSIEAWCNIDFENQYSNPNGPHQTLTLNGVTVKEVTIPNTVTAIKDYAFYYCEGITSITIPEGVTSIGFAAFYECNMLGKIICRAIVPPVVGTACFYGVPSAPVYVPAASVEAYRSHEGWGVFPSFIALPNPVHSITLSQSNAILMKGESLTLTATVAPEDAADKTVTWSTSDESIATVDDYGVVSAHQEGTVTITATAGSKMAVCVVVVLPYNFPSHHITSIDELNNEKLYSISLPYHSKGLATWAVPEGGTAMKSHADIGLTPDAYDAKQQFAFISNDGGATHYLYHPAEKKFVGKKGVLTEEPVDAILFKAGAYDNTFFAYFDNANYINVGGSHQMTIDRWSTADGGNSCLIVPVGDFDPSEAFKAFPIESITLSQSTANLIKGESLTLTATVVPDNATKAITWSTSDASIAVVDANGVVTAISAGTATITAMAGDKVALCQVTVENIAVSGITLSQSAASLLKGELLTLTATVVPADAFDKTVTWSTSDESIAAVDGNGVVTAVAEGTATITATAGGHSAACLITVEKGVAVSGITLQDRAFLVEGEVLSLTANIVPNNATNKTVIWNSSDESIVNVDDNGVVTAVAEGRATITATAGRHSAVCLITVEKGIAVSGITLSQSSVFLAEDKYFTLTATIVPDDATNKTVIWSSSNERIAAVDDNGLVSACNVGTATITANAGGKKAVCVVTVTPEYNITSIDELKNYQLYHVVLPYHSKGLTSWAVAEGGTEMKSNADLGLTPDDNDRKQRFAFISNDGGATHYLYHAAEKKFVGKKGVLSSQPVDAIRFKAGAYDNTFIAYFDDNNYINVGGSQQMTIDGWSTADGGNLCFIAPLPIVFDPAEALAAIAGKVSSISLSQTTASLVEGELLTLTATVAPEDAADKTVTWSTSDERIAVVDNKGVVTALTAGTATITAMAGGHSATCVVTVTREEEPFNGITSIDELNNNTLYYISLPHHSHGLCSWAVAEDGTAMKSNADLGLTPDATDTKQQFAFISNDGGVTHYLYHAAEKKFVGKKGVLTEEPVDAILFKDGAYAGTFLAYFDDDNHINVGGSSQMTIDWWSTPDGGNSCVIAPVGDFAPTEALKKFGSTEIVNLYTITYMVDGETYQTQQVKYGADVQPIAEPAKEGYTFSGWFNVPETMPAEDIVIEGWFVEDETSVDYITSLDELNNNTLYYISLPHHTHGLCSWAVAEGGTAMKSNADLGLTPDATDTKQQFAFISNDGGATHYLYHAAEKKFVGKKGVLTEEPVDAILFKDGAYAGTFLAYFDDDNHINVGGSSQMTIDWWSTPDGGNSCAIVPVGDFDPTEALKKFGNTEIVNLYTITYMVDGETIKSESLPEGSPITLPEEPTKEGHTFSGWSNVPETMPAEDIVISGSFTVNSYTITYMADGETYQTQQVKYGADVEPIAEPEKEGYTFSGWSNVPETMPAEDIVIEGWFVEDETSVDYITSLDELNNNTLYYISLPHHTHGLCSWAVAEGGTAMKSNADLGLTPDATDTKQQFAFISNDGGATHYLYHAAEKKFVGKKGVLTEEPVDAILFKDGAYAGTFLTYFDDDNHINVGGSIQMTIDWWSTPDGGNSCVIVPVGDFDPTEALKKFASGSTGIDNSEFTIQNSELIYDLSGRRVENPTKGMYIVNGLKVVVK